MLWPERIPGLVGLQVRPQASAGFLPPRLQLQHQVCILAVWNDENGRGWNLHSKIFVRTE